MRNLLVLLSILGVSFASSAAADDRREVRYGDLYDVEWCPCDPEEQLVNGSSVVMGKTVLCPCDSLYSGYDKGFKQEFKEAKENIARKLTAVNYFKYYIGFDWVKSKPGAVSEPWEIDDIRFQKPVSVNLDDIFDDSDSLSFVLGARLHKYFGLEAFYQKTYQDNQRFVIDNKTLSSSTRRYYLMNEYDTSFTAYGVDAVFYLPVSLYFDFLGSVGVGQYKFDNNLQMGVYEVDYGHLEEVLNQDFSEDKTGWRFAVGGQLNIAEGVALRGMYRYVSLGGEYIDDLQEFSVGLRFLF